MAIIPVTSSGVSAAYWVAAMLVPARQPESVRPARKYSSRPRDAFARAAKPAVMLYATKASTMSRSIIARSYPFFGPFVDGWCAAGYARASRGRWLDAPACPRSTR